MRRLGSFCLLLFLAVAPAVARRDAGFCGTTAETARESLFLHRQAQRLRGFRPRAATAVSANRDIGNIAIIEDADGVVVRQNEFNLNLKTLTFTPVTSAATAYRYSVSDQGYEESAAAAATPLAALDDDDSRPIALPFAFPFFGASYTQAFVNSDGNLTFTAGDKESSARSLGRMTSGPPRISALFDDLNPADTAGGVRVSSTADRVVVSWVAVPEWVTFGTGRDQTFQVKLYRDGRIEYSYFGVSPGSAVVGIAPGALKGSTTLVDFRNDPSGEYAAAVAERFGDELTLDAVTIAQRFYETHDDSYDYLVIYNDMDIDALDGAVAYADRVRSRGSGWGVLEEDTGREYGSASSLLAVLNMGQLSQYPLNPDGIVARRSAARDTPLTTIAHEAGHQFLAFASVTDPVDPTVRPMIGYGDSHWSFLFNSEASVLEGERIEDRGAAVSPRFRTAEVTQGYAPLDQYLMGLRPQQDVPDTFVVTGPSPAIAYDRHPQGGVSFDGTRRDISIGEIVRTMGRRTPDHTVAQRRFRFAFILVTAAGAQPAAVNVERLETYRQRFEAFFSQATNGNATADTSLRRSLRLSLFPASGVVAGTSTTASLSLQTPPSSDLTVQLQAPVGSLEVPPSVTIPAGGTGVGFTVGGKAAGVEELTAVPGDPAYANAFARVQVADAAMLKLVPVSGERQISTGAAPLPEPVIVRLTDANGLPYNGARIVATASEGGIATPAAALTDGSGQVAVQWTPGDRPSNTLRLALAGEPSVALSISAGAAVPVAAAVVNAASFEQGIAAGAIQTITGVNLAGGRTEAAPYPWPARLGDTTVQLNGAALPLLYVSDRQINFYVPAEVPTGPGVLAVIPPSGTASYLNVEVKIIQPGIFPGAVVRSGTTLSAATTPVSAGDYIEIYCTGLGPTRLTGNFQRTIVSPVVFIGAVPVHPSYSGLAPGWTGLYQVNLRVPEGLAPGTHPLILSINLEHSNEVPIAVQ